ncbi:MAG: OpgC domain-containing protein [Alphaproteobacteria bacterium]|nr:MAG: OpgC domain-containing protein [Alphaproteobacteria bacterium]
MKLTPAVHIDADNRDLRLDACRGLALWFIFLDHIPHNALAWLSLRNYGFSDTSEVFVFVSGYTCMLAYGGALPEQGWTTIFARAIRRAWEIYAAFLLLLIAYFVLIWVAGDGARYLDETNTRPFFEDPGAAVVHAVLLQYAAVNTDILPTFALLHLVFPPLLWLFIRGREVVLAASFALYLIVQIFGWHLPAWPNGELYFNPLAWQFLFVFGAWYSEEGAGRLKKIVQSRAALALALLYLVLSLAIALTWQIKPLEGFIPNAVSKLIYPIDKSHLAPVRLLHFLALAIVVSRLTPPDWRGLSNPWLTAMIRCGENSLAMYCLSVLLSFGGLVILNRISSSFAMQAAVSVAGIALMIAVATLLTWEAKRDRRGPKLF